MSDFPFTTFTDTRPCLGLVVLQSDETIEDELRTILPRDARLMVSRVPSATEVTRDTLAEMESHLTSAAALFPQAARFDVVGYGCTSGTAQIGAAHIASLIRAGTKTSSVTEPVSALVAACSTLSVTRLAFLSPYVASVSNHLRDVLRGAGIDTPVFGSFGEGDETTVAHIDAASVRDAALALMDGSDVDALFLSCTNLKTFSVIPALEDALGVPVLSSNLVLGWDMLRRAGPLPGATMPGQLLRV